MILPNFIIVGPQRSGTTWIYNCLKRHPNICMPIGVKETFFFDKHFKKGFNWYAWHFSHCEPKNMIGEVAPSYFHNSIACKRIKKYIPECKIICTLRNPVERVFSLYLHMRRYGMIKYDFKRALKEESVLLNSSRYFSHLSRWIEFFGKEKIKVLIFDDLKKDPIEYIYNLFNFLEVSNIPSKSIEKGKINIADYPRTVALARFAQTMGDLLRSKRLYGLINIAKKVGLKQFVFSGGINNIPKMDNHTKKYLISIFSPEIDKLEKCLSRELTSWK